MRRPLLTSLTQQPRGQALNDCNCAYLTRDLHSLPISKRAAHHFLFFNLQPVSELQAWLQPVKVEKHKIKEVSSAALHVTREALCSRPSPPGGDVAHPKEGGSLARHWTMAPTVFVFALCVFVAPQMASAAIATSTGATAFCGAPLFRTRIHGSSPARKVGAWHRPVRARPTLRKTTNQGFSMDAGEEMEHLDGVSPWRVTTTAFRALFLTCVTGVLSCFEFLFIFSNPTVNFDRLRTHSYVWHLPYR